MNSFSFSQMLSRLLKPGTRSRAAKTVEVFGWFILVEGGLMLIAPHFAASILRLPQLTDQAANYFRLIGLLAGGVSMFYIVCGRVDAHGFVFASLLDRPLVPIVMAVLW